jgi:hypothetical protein
MSSRTGSITEAVVKGTNSHPRADCGQTFTVTNNLVGAKFANKFMLPERRSPPHQPGPLPTGVSFVHGHENGRTLFLDQEHQELCRLGVAGVPADQVDSVVAPAQDAVRTVIATSMRDLGPCATDP